MRSHDQRCVECGEEMWVDDVGGSYHFTPDGDGIDYDADADHQARPAS